MFNLVDQWVSIGVTNRIWMRGYLKGAGMTQEQRMTKSPPAHGWQLKEAPAGALCTAYRQLLSSQFSSPLGRAPLPADITPFGAAGYCWEGSWETSKVLFSQSRSILFPSEGSRTFPFLLPLDLGPVSRVLHKKKIRVLDLDSIRRLDQLLLASRTEAGNESKKYGQCQVSREGKEMGPFQKHWPCSWPGEVCFRWQLLDYKMTCLCWGCHQVSVNLL